LNRFPKQKLFLELYALPTKLAYIFEFGKYSF
jgi:hypothetical protein